MIDMITSENNNNRIIKPLLGQWHSPEDNVLPIWQHKLEVRCLDKLENVVDYQATGSSGSK